VSERFSLRAIGILLRSLAVLAIGVLLRSVPVFGIGLWCCSTAQQGAIGANFRQIWGNFLEHMFESLLE
jgi:hypothetical protein